MYLAVVALTMVVLPLASIVVGLSFGDAPVLMALAGKWFVFWAVGVRLLLAGVRQSLNPKFTARQIFHVQASEALPVVRELGVANLAIGVVGLSSLYATSFVVPAALYSTIFYGVAAIGHARQGARSRNETIAMASDFWIAAVLAPFLLWRTTA